jgi:AcrR family transcriptional regulator
VTDAAPRSQPSEAADARASVLRAARACFLRYGVRRTSMEDVAKAAGITRQALYRVVAGAGELAEAVIVERIREIADELRPITTEAATFEEVVYTIAVASIDGARKDEELQNFFETSSTLRIHHLMTGHFPQISDIVVELFRPALDQARRDGKLRDDLTDKEVVDWIRGVQLMLILRDDLDPTEERDMLRKFLIPSITAPTSWSTAHRTRQTVDQAGHKRQLG